MYEFDLPIGLVRRGTNEIEVTMDCRLAERVEDRVLHQVERQVEQQIESERPTQSPAQVQ